MIYLNDILQLSESEISNAKIRFNKSNNIDFDPISLFKEKDLGLYNGHFWNSKVKSFREGQIAIGFIRISTDKWLLFDISIITKDLEIYNGAGYDYTTLEKYKKYFGRLIIQYKNKSQNMIRNASNVLEDCIIHQIIEDTYENDIFPGYENIDLSWNDLRKVIVKNDWKAALENQKGVYLITDTATGKRYVGSAYGEQMILGRWSNYVMNGHGGNKDLKQLDFEYIKNNFKYSVLDIFKSTTDDKTIINREHFWMKIMLSKDKRYGYNN